MSEIVSGFNDYYILGVNEHYFEKSTISRFLIVSLPNVAHLENAWKQHFRFEFKRTFIPLCITIWKSILYNAGKIAAFAPKLQRIKYGSNAGRKKSCACPAN